jgi:hypothetical protein
VCHAPAFNESPQNDARSSAIVILLLRRRQADAERVFARLVCFNRSPVPVDRIVSKELSAHNWSGCTATEIPDSAPLSFQHPQNEQDNAMNDLTHHQGH